jgi:hypothetical protein
VTTSKTRWQRSGTSGSITPVIALLALLALASPVPGDRVFMTPVRADGVEPAARVAIEEALLTAARARNPAAVGSTDVAALLDAEAAIQAAGCDSAGCDAELADALGAPELLSAQLMRIEQTTWVLTLKRLRRADMHVLASHQVTRVGESPMVIVAGIDELSDVVVGARASRPLQLVAGVGVGTGVVAGAVGGLMLLGGLLKFNEGTAALSDGDAQTAYETRRDFEWLTPTGTLMAIGGGALVVVGAVAFGVDAAIGAAP